jgi:hypothetical protein
VNSLLSHSHFSVRARALMVPEEISGQVGLDTLPIELSAARAPSLSAFQLFSFSAFAR